MIQLNKNFFQLLRSLTIHLILEIYGKFSKVYAQHLKNIAVKLLI